jgi:Ca-activated chloride channel family protein
MRRSLPVLLLALAWCGPVSAAGILIPIEKKVPPLAMLYHRVEVSIEDQAAVTRVEQTFRNHTDRPLEATYVFPVPRGASVQKFTMWVNGKEAAGELVQADQARRIYTEIVRRTQDPGLLEYMGNDLLRLRVFPIPARADQKVAVRFLSVCPREDNLVSYTYPLKNDGKAVQTLEDFSVRVTLKAQHPIQNIYSPTHPVTVTRHGDKEASVHFERSQANLDKDFQLYYGVGDGDVGLTFLAQRPIASENGYFLMLVSPRPELSQSQTIPRDMVLVLDTSGSMRGPKMEQARKALKYCLDNLNPQDRFALINFATVVNLYKSGLLPSDKDQVAQAKKWVDNLEATGGTAIDEALKQSLALRTTDEGRTFTVVFFTDGQPTVGETDPERILKDFATRNTGNTRVFTFGVGDDVNATMLDRLAEQTRAVATYVRPEEDIEAKTSALYSKISHPVLANLKLSVGSGVMLSEVYPPQLPDLFHGGQLVVLGRYSGHGHAAIKLTGQVGKEQKDFVYETNFVAKTTQDRDFVEHLWARRKVGYLLDQIRANGEKKELVDEVVTLAKRYGIATPYTSYLIVPDAPAPVLSRAGMPGGPGLAGRPGGGFGGFGGGGAGYGMPATPPALTRPGGGAKPVSEFAKDLKRQTDDLTKSRDKVEGERLRKEAGEAKGDGKAPEQRRLREALEKKQAFDEARKALGTGNGDAVRAGKLGVDLSVQMIHLRNQTRLERTAVRRVGGRTCLEIGGVWIDEGFDTKTPTLAVKAQSDAYFRLLERHPELKAVYQLGNHLVWVTPSGTALIVDAANGKEQLGDDEIDRLFVAKK